MLGGVDDVDCVVDLVDDETVVDGETCDGEDDGERVDLVDDECLDLGGEDDGERVDLDGASVLGGDLSRVHGEFARVPAGLVGGVGPSMDLGVLGAFIHFQVVLPGAGPCVMAMSLSENA